MNNDLLRVENSLGRLSDQHFAASQIELLKATALLDKGADKNAAELYKQNADSFAKTQLDMAKLELSLAKQAAENFANVQIENAKNRLGLEQKIVETGNDIKMNVLKEAESVLRNASMNPNADSRVRQNLALVLSLQGKFEESEAISRQDLSPADAQANIQQVREMIAQSNSWSRIQDHTPAE